jgi:hypothetical protein
VTKPHAAQALALRVASCEATAWQASGKTHPDSVPQIFGTRLLFYSSTSHHGQHGEGTSHLLQIPLNTHRSGILIPLNVHCGPAGK